MSKFLSPLLFVSLAASFCLAAGQVKTFGTAPTIKEVTSIKSITTAPQRFVDKEVLVSGKVFNVCQGSGCWVEVENSDGSKIICKSLDETVLMPKDCKGQSIQVQGTVKIDNKASGLDEMKKEGDGPVHACPAPKVFVSTSGASLTLAEPATASNRAK